MTAKITRKIVTAFLTIIAALIIMPGSSLSVYATDEFEEMEFDQFFRALQHVDAKAEPDDNAETIFSYDKGAIAFVTGETNDGWYIVYYQGRTGYINKYAPQGGEAIPGGQGGSAVFEAVGIDVEALNDEMAAQEVESKLIVEEVERVRTEERRSKIWGAVIVLLIIGIFAVGIVSTIRSEKKNKEDISNPPKNKESRNDEKDKSVEKRSGKKTNDLKIIDLDKE